MKHLILISAIMISLIVVSTMIIADTLNRTDSTITFDKSTTDALRTRNISSINVNATGFTCDSNECWSDVYQNDLINTQFRTPKNYCTRYSECLDPENCQQTCLSYTDYTLTELVNMRNTFIKERIESYAKTITTSTTTKLDDGGTITGR